MKKIIYSLLIVLFILPFDASAQVFNGFPNDSVVITFTGGSIPDFIPDTAAIPLWQIGHSYKSFFGLDSSGVVTIMTDTLITYPANANNWFIIKFEPTFNIIVDLWHKYQTNSGHAGGIVEFSLDYGVTWQNVKGPCNVDSTFGGLSGVFTTNFYSTIDTLYDGEPAFTGTNDSVQYSRFQFFEGYPERKMSGSGSGSGCDFIIDTFYVRFRFVSDSTIDSLAGWKIDSIKIENNIYSGLVNNINKSQSLNTYPNPSYDGLFAFPHIENEKEYTMTIYNAMGQKVLNLPYSNAINLSAYPKGLYFYEASNGTNFYSGQLETY